MGNKATQDKDVKDGNPQDNPNPNPNPQPDPTEELRRENERLRQQLIDKDRFITDLNAEKSTLETRLQQNTPPPSGNLEQDTRAIMEKAQIDPDGAGKDLADLIRRTSDTAQQATLQTLRANLQPAIENNVYAAKVKSENKDLIDHFGEDYLSLRVSQRLQSKQSATFKDAVDAVVKESRTKLNSLKSNATIPTPPEAQGEDGGNQPPPTPPPPPQPETQEDEIERRKKERQARGL